MWVLHIFRDNTLKKIMDCKVLKWQITIMSLLYKSLKILCAKGADLKDFLK